MPEPRIHLASVNEQVVSALREMILAGTLPPGARLPEVGLSRQFGVSRNTIREAVRAVAREGLVNVDRNKTATVAELTDADVPRPHTVADCSNSRRSRTSKRSEKPTSPA